MNNITDKARINEIDIHYRLMGSGEPLLLITGLSGNMDWWDGTFLESLAKKYRVAIFDNRGSGRTDEPDGPYTIEQMASDTAGLMDHLGWDSSHVVGESMGGMIAQQLALDYPDRVKKLVLACSACGGKEQVLADPGIYSMLFAPVDRSEITQETIARGTLGLLFPQQYMEENPDKMEECVRRFLIAPTSPRGFMNQFKGILSWSSYSRLGELRQPTLVIAGEEDIFVPAENSRILAEAIPDSRLVIIPAGGHGFIMQYPERVSEEILRFLEQ